ncbi:alpha/beta hydrolase [Fischerella thermalis]|uniref:alpha/beta hydrolase n=1 Tax=Fischerella thermalis TaxID=372787 RepID=UPI0021554219|nr:alpha/beta hydrolase [Fischerella thermalis]
MQIWQFFNRLKHANFTFVFSQIVALGISASVLLHSTNANAAEQVVLKYGNFQGVVSVKELNQFVETGKTTPALKAYLQAAQQNP